MVASFILLDAVEDFIQSLSLPRKEAKGCLHCVEDCQAFYIGFYGRNPYAIDDLLDYREDRINNSKIMLDESLQLCYTSNMLDVFTKTFYQAFTLADMVIINESINRGEVTLESLFTNFQKNPNENILKNVL